ncbi:DUF2252 domain-containing protein [Pseudonocardia yunnanensis]|uniref:DUF2252 domain-containing protein n=1 Tax=Pseudonocardia yunnanensis TaxID=58107 RepID=A0ABW4EPI5_9PSEU
MDRGRSARRAVPRAGQAEFTPVPDRPDPLSLLEKQAQQRVQELLPIRYGRMAASPFAYFRGAALPMASDLAGTQSTGLVVQCCGDAHMTNFGVFASPERRLVFDVNDFDETLPGPWEWDVKRLATSIEIAGRDNGFPTKARREIVTATVAAYRRAMREFADATTLEVWYAHADMDSVQARVDEHLDRERRKRLARSMAKARTRDNLGALGRYAGVKDGHAAIIADPPLVVPITELAGAGTDPAQLLSQLRDMLMEYRECLEPERRALLDQYRLVDFARKVVGVGSVGTRAYIALLLGDDDRDPLFLQAKEAGPSVLEEFVGASDYDPGRRVVVGQRLMQAVSDIFLGWVRVQGFDGQPRSFYLRQLRDWKGSADVEVMAPKGMLAYGELCGWTLARAHARTGDRVAIASYLGAGTTFERAIAEFARAYADQNEQDHQELVDAIASGRIEAESGV